MVMMTERQLDTLRGWISAEAAYQAAVMVGRPRGELELYKTGAMQAERNALRALGEPHP